MCLESFGDSCIDQFPEEHIAIFRSSKDMSIRLRETAFDFETAVLMARIRCQGTPIVFVQQYHGISHARTQN